MAGAGKKTFAVNEVLSAADVNNYLMDQSVMRFADSTARSSAIGTPSEGMVSYLDDSNQVEVFDGSSWVNFTGDINQVTAGTALTGGGTEGNVTLDVDETELFTGGTAGYTALSNGTAGLSYQPVSHNYVINGAFDIWQRGTSFSGVLSGQYTADRWRPSAATANLPDWTVDQVSFTPDELVANGFGDARFFYRSTLTDLGSATAAAIGHRVEDVRTLAGQTATLSFWAKSDSTRTQSFRFLQLFGSGGSPLVEVGNTTFETTTSWQRFTFTFTVPSISGKTIGSGSWVGPDIAQAFAAGSVLDIWGVQLEAGSIATPFKRNANSIAGELAACSRYFERLNIGRINTATSGNSTVMSLPYMTRKRSTPSVSTTATNANYGSVWSFSQSGVSLSSKSGTVTINFDGTSSELNHLQINAVGATYSPIPNTLEGLSGLNFDIDAEL